jgi:signal transduction histidine kinase
MTTTCHRILYIEDDIALARLLQKRLSAKTYDVTVKVTAQEGITALNSEEYDLVLLDNFLPDLEGIEVLTALQPLEDRPPILLLTASGDERLAIDALEKGAADYVVKDAGLAYIDLLPAVMQAAYTRFRLAKENRTQREELRDAWEKAQVANKAKSAFLSAISHEIRTPLNVIIGAALLLEKTTMDDRQKSLSSTLKSNAELLLALVNDTLDLNKIEAGAMTLELLPFQTGEMQVEMDKMFRNAISQKGLEFIVSDKANAVRWLGDFLRIKQILINLISNSLKFTEKGHITLETDITPDGSLRFVIQDTGIGIPLEKQHMIFESFSQADQSTTRHYGGSGLGLAICRALTFLMNGTIKLESEEGKGTRFTVTLPLKRLDDGAYISVANHDVRKSATNINTNAEQPALANDSKPASLLLVEDYPANAMIAQMMLADMGYHVTWVSSGADALKTVKEALEPFHAILMDIQMQGMDGYTTTREIRTWEHGRHWHQHIIGVTAHALQDEADRCRKAGMDDYLSKPVNWDVLQKKLADL